MTEPVLSEKRDGKLIITLNRPEAINALNLDLLRSLNTVVDGAIVDDEVKVVLIQAAGTRGFCAGLDTKQLAQFREKQDGSDREFFTLLYSICKKIDTMPKLVVSAGTGHAIAAGAQILTSADVIIAGEGLKMLENEMRGTGFNDESWPIRLSKQVGPVRAKAYVFLMETLNGREAFELGLVSKVVPDDQLAEYAERVSTQMVAYQKTPVVKTLWLIDQGA